MGVTAVIAAGVVVSAVGQKQAADAQADALDAQGRTAEYNAEISKINAENARLSSTATQLQLRREQRQFLGTQRAFAAQSGVGVGGSNRDVIEQSKGLAELDALNIAYEGELKAHGYLTQSNVDSLTASMYHGQAGGVSGAGTLSAVGTVIGGYGKYKGYT